MLYHTLRGNRRSIGRFFLRDFCKIGIAGIFLCLLLSCSTQSGAGDIQGSQPAVPIGGTASATVLRAVLTPTSLGKGWAYAPMGAPHLVESSCHSQANEIVKVSLQRGESAIIQTVFHYSSEAMARADFEKLATKGDGCARPGKFEGYRLGQVSVIVWPESSGMPLRLATQHDSWVKIYTSSLAQPALEKVARSNA